MQIRDIPHFWHGARMIGKVKHARTVIFDRVERYKTTNTKTTTTCSACFEEMKVWNRLHSTNFIKIKNAYKVIFCRFLTNDMCDKNNKIVILFCIFSLRKMDGNSFFF